MCRQDSGDAKTERIANKPSTTEDGLARAAAEAYTPVKLEGTTTPVDAKEQTPANATDVQKTAQQASQLLSDATSHTNILAAQLAAGKKDSDKVEITTTRDDGSQSKGTITVSTLRQLVIQEAEGAIKAADQVQSAPQADLLKARQENTRRIGEVIGELGLKGLAEPDMLRALNERYNAAGTSVEQRKKIEELASLAAKQDLLEHPAAYTRVTAAALAAQGILESKPQINAGKLQPSERSLQSARGFLAQAVELDGAYTKSEFYQTVNVLAGNRPPEQAQPTTSGATQLRLAEHVYATTQQAEGLIGKDPARLALLGKQAYDEAQGIDLRFARGQIFIRESLPDHLKADPRIQADQQNLWGIVHAASRAEFLYTNNVLLQQGKGDEALPILLRIRAQDPMIARESSKDLVNAINAAKYGASDRSLDQLLVHQSRFNDFINNPEKKKDPNHLVSAEKELTALEQGASAAKEQIDRQLKDGSPLRQEEDRLTKALAAIQAEKTKEQGNSNSNPQKQAEITAEEIRIRENLASIRETIQGLAADQYEYQRQYLFAHYYLRGCYDLAQARETGNHRDEVLERVHTSFEEAKKHIGEILPAGAKGEAAEKELIARLGLDELLKQTRTDFWYKHWNLIASLTASGSGTVSGIGAGLAAGFLIGGPIGAGVGLVVGGLIGAGTGSLAYAEIKEKCTDEQSTTKDYLIGAGLGLLGGATAGYGSAVAIGGDVAVAAAGTAAGTATAEAGAGAATAGAGAAGADAALAGVGTAGAATAGTGAGAGTVAGTGASAATGAGVAGAGTDALANIGAGAAENVLSNSVLRQAATTLRPLGQLAKGAAGGQHAKYIVPGSFGYATVHQGYNVVALDKPVGEAITDGIEEGIGLSLSGGMLAHAGKAAIIGGSVIGTGYSAHKQLGEVGADKPLAAVGLDFLSDGAQVAGLAASVPMLFRAAGKYAAKGIPLELTRATGTTRAPLTGNLSLSARVDALKANYANQSLAWRTVPGTDLLKGGAVLGAVPLALGAYKGVDSGLGYLGQIGTDPLLNPTQSKDRNQMDRHWGEINPPTTPPKVSQHSQRLPEGKASRMAQSPLPNLHLSNEQPG